jgi:hypothetical protein
MKGAAQGVLSIRAAISIPQAAAQQSLHPMGPGQPGLFGHQPTGLALNA